MNPNNHLSNLPPIINDAPTQEQHLKHGHDNLEHHKISPSSSISSSTSNNNNNNNNKNINNNKNNLKSSTGLLAPSSSPALSNISSQIDNFFPKISATQFQHHQQQQQQQQHYQIQQSQTHQHYQYEQQKQQQQQQRSNNLASTTSSTSSIYNTTTTYSNNTINNNGYNNGDFHHLNNTNQSEGQSHTKSHSHHGNHNNHHHHHQQQQHNNNNNNNNNSDKKPSSKSISNNFYDYINGSENTSKRKLSDFNDDEIDGLLESFDTKKNNNTKKSISNNNNNKSGSGSNNNSNGNASGSINSSNSGGINNSKKSSNNKKTNTDVMSPAQLSSPILNTESTTSSKTLTTTKTTISSSSTLINNNNNNNENSTATTTITTSTSESTSTTSSTSVSPQPLQTTTTTTTTTTKKDSSNILEFPYNISTLNWDIDHLNNKENCYCYCGKNKERVMIRCDSCKQMFHVSCLRNQGVHLYGDWVYRFTCSVCTEGNEAFERFSKNWGDILEITLFNLQQNRIDQLEKCERKSPNTPSTFQSIKTTLPEESNMDEINFNNIKHNQTNILKKGIFFHLDEEIIPFIEKNWNLLCSDKKKKSQWQKPLLPALTSGRIFKSGFINYSKKNMWALGTDQLLLKDNSIYKDIVLAPLNKSKRKKKKSKEEENRDNEITRLLLLPSKDKIFVPTIEYDILCIAKENSAPQIKLIDNHFLTVSNDEGYRMARSSFPCICGNWYFEIEVLNSEGNTRLGWSTPKGDCQANVGYDQYSYSYRNSQGDIFHNARSKKYGEPFGKGDVIGFFISLPENQSTTQREKDFPFINQLEIYDMVSNEHHLTALSASALSPLQPQPPPLDQQNPQDSIIPNSFIQFFKNGKSPGPAFTNLTKGSYYPSASMYMKSMVKFNFGPNFKFLPSENYNLPNFKPFSYIIKKD